MTIHEELHRLVDALDGHAAKRLLRALIDDLNEEQSHAVLGHLRRSHHRFLEDMGFSL